MVITVFVHHFLFGFQLIAESIPEDPFREDWILALTVTPIFLYLIAVATEKQLITVLARTVFNNRYAFAQFRNKSNARLLTGFVLGIVTMINISTFLYFVGVTFDIRFFGLSGPLLWCFTFGIVGVSALFRYTVSVIAGELTGSRKLFDEYYYNISRFYMFLSVILLFINFLIPYLVIIPDIFFIVFSCVLLALLLILRIIRLSSIILRRSFSLLYMILYLCALEITPVLIFIKYLSGTL